MRKHPIVYSIYRFFKSIKLALILIGYLVLTSLVSTFIPQGKDPVFYAHEYPGTLYRIITGLDMDNFFRSFLFLVPLTLFFINLAVCTIDRIVTRIKRRSLFRPGPDIIHVGLLILMIAGVFTLFERREGFTFLAPGDRVKLPGGYTIELKSFTFTQYPDGRPKLWISDMELTSGSNIKRRVTVQVNKPLRIGTLNVFQFSYKDFSAVSLSDGAGKTVLLNPGKTLSFGSSVYRLAKVSTVKDGMTTTVTDKNNDGTSELTAVFFKSGGSGAERLLLHEGDSIGGYTITELVPRLETGLNIVDDPGYHVIIAALILIGIGLTVTFIQKKGDFKP